MGYLKFSEVLEAPLFKEKIEKTLRALVHERLCRPKPKEGYDYKRDWYDRLGSKLTTEYIMKHIGSVYAKASKLSREERSVIEYVGSIALRQYLIETNPNAKDNESKTT